MNKYVEWIEVDSRRRMDKPAELEDQNQGDEQE
jgi:hypothetical protein